MHLYDQIDAYRMLTYKELQEHLSSSQDEYRLGRLLFKLSTLAEIDTNIIEEIFFAGLIGKKTKTFIRIISIVLIRFSTNP